MSMIGILLRGTTMMVSAAIVTSLAGCTQPTAPLSPTPSQVSAPSATPREPLSAANQIRVVSQAEGFLRALARPAKSRDDWWGGVQPYLTADAAKTLSSLQPSAVGFTRLNGSGHLVAPSERDSPNARTVTVLTDAGVFTVEITNPTGDSRINSYRPLGGSPVGPNPTYSTADEDSLKRFATTFMQAFAKPKAGVGTRRWWERVASMLTDDAVDTYADITPEVVPVRQVTGPVKVEPPDGSLGDDAETIRAVTVGTDAGVYRLIIQTPSEGVSDRPLVMEIQEP